MKIEVLLSRVALPIALATVVAVALGALAFEFFAAYVATLLLLTAAGDYTRGAQLLPLKVTAAPRRRVERMPLAA